MVAVYMSFRELMSLHAKNTEPLETVLEQIMELWTVGRLEAELARAREAITTKDSELEDLHHQVDEAKAENERA